jgi:hypothetical protein
LYLTDTLLYIYIQCYCTAAADVRSVS